MKLSSRLALTVLCLALICGAAVAWHFVKARTSAHKIAEETKACRVRAEQGDAKAQAELGDFYYLGKGVPQDYGQAFEWYRKAADKGNPKGQCGLAYTYQEGRGVQQDRSQAIGWYRKAADQGYAKAQYALGYSYYEGWEVPRDYTESVRWYRKAADQGYAKAQTELGYMYSQGKGVPQDYAQAMQLYRKAADQGYSRAQSALAYAYSVGKGGVPQDYALSARWYRKAAKQGDDYALRALEAMNIGFTASDKVSLFFQFLGSVVLLMGSRLSLRSRKERRLTFAGLLLLLSVGLKVYGYSHLGILQSLSLVNAFFFCRSFLVGVGVAMLLAFLWPQGFKAALGVCAMLFIAFNVYATMHYDLRHFAACPQAFYSLNALLIGAVITLGILLWTIDEQTTGTPNGIRSETSRA